MLEYFNRNRDMHAGTPSSIFLAYPSTIRKKNKALTSFVIGNLRLINFLKYSQLRLIEEETLHD